MKCFKLILTSCVFVTLLTNCGVNKNNKATTNTKTPVQPSTSFCQQNPNHASCTNNGHTTKTMTGFFNVSDRGEYERMLKGVFGFCDATSITYTGEFWSTLLGSALTTSVQRCSKWNQRGALKMVFLNDGRLSLQMFAYSNFSGGIQNNYVQLFYIPFAQLTPYDNDQKYYINLDNYANGHRTGLALYIEGDINSDSFEVIFEHHGKDMATIRMNPDQYLY